MAVIPLTSAGATPSVVTSYDDFRREGEAILIMPPDPTQLGIGVTECNATYDLRVGEIYRDHRNVGGQELGQNQSIQVLPGSAVIIETEETVAFPISRFGQILPKVSLLQQGIANTPSKVDPGYSGHLLITAFNHGKQTVMLRRGQRFCSLHIFDVELPVKPYNKDGKRITSARPRARWLRRTRDWIDSNVAFVTFINTLVAVGSLFVAAVAFFHGK